MNVNRQSSIQDILNQDFESSKKPFSFIVFKKKTRRGIDNNNISGAAKMRTNSTTINHLITPEVRRQTDVYKTAAKGPMPAGCEDILMSEEDNVRRDTAQGSVPSATSSTTSEGARPPVPGKKPPAIANPTANSGGGNEAEPYETFAGIFDFDDDNEWEDCSVVGLSTTSQHNSTTGKAFISLQGNPPTKDLKKYRLLDDSTESGNEFGKHKVYERLCQRKFHLEKKGRKVRTERNNINSTAIDESGAEDKSDSETSAPVKPDDEWRRQQLKSISLSGLESIMSEILPSYGDSDSSVAYSEAVASGTAIGFPPKTCQDSYSALHRMHMEISSFLDEQVASSAHRQPFYFPSQFLPVSFHSHFFEYMNKKHNAVLKLQTKNTKNLQRVVNLIRKYIVEMSIRKLSGHLEDFPDDAQSISLRNVFKMWYCNSFGVRPEYHEGRKGRGQRYTETEIFAIEFGMYKYPAAKKVGAVGQENFDWRWGAILQDRNLKKDLAGRSKEQIAEKAKTMCIDKIWDSLKYFYVQQLLLCRDVSTAKKKLFQYVDMNRRRKRPRN